MHACLALLLLSCYFINGEALGFTQSVAVRGRLMCNGAAASGVKLKLYDVDTFDMDDLISESRSDGNGNFFLAGSEREFTSIDPKLNIYHNCNDNFPCDRKVSIIIPDTYIADGAVPYRVYDAGLINLEGKFSGESRDCLNR